MDTQPRLADALALALTVGDEAIVRPARATHAAVVNRLQSVAPYVLPAKLVDVTQASLLMHKGLSMVAYVGASLGLRAGARGLAAAGDAAWGESLEDGPRGRFVRSSVNGLLGERLIPTQGRMAIRLSVRQAGVDVRPTRAGLAAAFPDATSQVVVFMHGLCENESYWRKDFLERGTTYADRLTEVGWTPVMMRANTGRPIGDNGAELSALLERVISCWPVPVSRIALVGHSLGGLVVRSACAPDSDGILPEWAPLVSDVITLGTPHLGAPLARAINRGSAALAKLPETAGFADALDQRAVSIDELMQGLDESVPPLETARYRLVCATLTREPDALLARTVGDLLVTPASAYGEPADIDERRLQRLFPGADLLHVARADHLDLLNHAEVGEALVGWLSAAGEHTP